MLPNLSNRNASSTHLRYFIGQWWGWVHKVNWKGPITKGTTVCVEPINFISQTSSHHI